MRTLAILLLPFALSACSSDDDAVAVDAGNVVIDADTAGGDLTLPTTVTMSTGFGGPLSVGICQNLKIGGGIVMSVQAAPQCLGGEVYLTWVKGAVGDTYSVTAGKILTENNDGAAVVIQATSTGSVTKAGESDTVAGLTAGSDITIETAGHSAVTFSFVGDDFTLSALTAR